MKKREEFTVNPMREYVENTIWSIRDTIRSCDFDCRQLLHPYSNDAEYEWNMTEEFRKGYIVPKYAVAKVLQPKRVLEIGVYRGIAALSFLGAVPGLEYVGVDCTPEPWVVDSKKIFDRLGYNTRIVHASSLALSSLPDGPYDLIHVDGDHSRAGACNDVKLAFNAVKPDGWILVDDACDCKVCTGTFDAMLELPGGNIYWTLFEGTTASIFIQRTRQ